MSEVETAPSAGASESTPSPTPSPSVESTADLVSMMKKAGQTAPESDNSGSPADAESSEPAPAEAKAAPEGESPVEPKAKEEAAKPEGAEETPPPTPEQSAENIRQAIKSSNLPPAQKAELADLAYTGKALKETGFTVEAARQFKDLGLEPAAVIDRVKLHPTIEDAKLDSDLARDMRSLAQDFGTTPELFARKLYDSNPAAASRVAKEYIQNAYSLFPEEYVAEHASSAKTFLQRLAAEAKQNEDVETEASIERVLEKSGLGPATAQARVGPDPNSPEIRELQNLRAWRAQQEQARQQNEAGARQQFGVAVRDQGAATIRKAVEEWVGKAKPTGMNTDLVARVIDDTFNGVVSDLLKNQNFVMDMNGYSQGPLTKEQFIKAMAHAERSAKAHIPIHMKPAFDRWGKYSIAEQSQKDATQAKAASRPDVGKTAGRPSASHETDMATQVLADARAKGVSDPLEMIRRFRAGAR